MTASPSALMSNATSNEAKPSTRTTWPPRIDRPLGYAAGVPERAKTDRVSTALGSEACRLVGSPQAFRPTTADIAASSARRAFIKDETDVRLEGLPHDNTP